MMFQLNLTSVGRIYTPLSTTPRSRLAVLFWVHGGTFVTGGSSDASLDGAAYAEKHNMLVVVPNYRLGLLGFLKSSDRQLSGNYGLKDLMMSLRKLPRYTGKRILC